MTTSDRPRARDLGIQIGALPTGKWNAITDVAGVRVGHTTLVRGEGSLIPGVGPVRTGVTAILPQPGDLFEEKVVAAVHRINGFGEVTNSEQVHEMGVLEGPIMLTGTMNVPRVADAVIDWALARNPAMGVTTWGISPIVAECSDAWLNDLRGRHVNAQHVFAAIEAATSGPVAEGCVGSGTGMSCYEFKGGIGTSSRVIDQSLGGFTVGVLVMSNFGRRTQLRIDGVPVGQALADWPEPAATAAPPGRSSIIIVLATDAPMDPRQLRRLCVRAGAGLARTGSTYGTTSGDFLIAFSTANRIPHAPKEPSLPIRIVAEDGPVINALFGAVVEATEEAILNSLFKATTMVGRDGHTRYALPIEATLAILGRHGREVNRLR